MNNYSHTLIDTTYKLHGHKTLTIKEEMAIFESISDSLMPDVYGTGEVIEKFQNFMSDDFDKEAAVFFPSGTMAQQIALRIWCDKRGINKIAYHPLCHLEIHENDGVKKLHQIETTLLGEEGCLFTIDDLKSLGEVSAVLFELPQREIGGQLPSWDELVAMTTYCRDHDIHTHLDGARLYECLPFYKKTPKEVGELFDTIYISFYKGFGSISGAMLIGPHEIMKEAKIWKRRYGGDLYHLYPYIIPALDAFLKRRNKMTEYYEGAKEYALKLSTVNGLKIVPEVPVCNMFHVFFKDSAENISNQLIKIMLSDDVALFDGISSTADGLSKAEIYIGDTYSTVEEAIIDKAIDHFRRIRSL